MLKYDETKPLTDKVLDRFKEGSTIFLNFDAVAQTPKRILDATKSKGILVEVYDYTMKFQKSVEVEIDIKNQLKIITRWAKYKPELLEKILKVQKVSCPFPGECKQFPCDDMWCNADSCDNGHPYRMS